MYSSKFHQARERYVAPPTLGREPNLGYSKERKSVGENASLTHSTSYSKQEARKQIALITERGGASASSRFERARNAFTKNPTTPPLSSLSRHGDSASSFGKTGASATRKYNGQAESKPKPFESLLADSDGQKPCGPPVVVATCGGFYSSENQFNADTNEQTERLVTSSKVPSRVSARAIPARPMVTETVSESVEQSPNNLALQCEQVRGSIQSLASVKETLLQAHHVCTSKHEQAFTFQEKKDAERFIRDCTLELSQSLSAELRAIAQLMNARVRSLEQMAASCARKDEVGAAMTILETIQRLKLFLESLPVSCK